jgi:putative transposase
MCQWGATFCARARWRSTAGGACARVAKGMRKKAHSTPLAPFFLSSRACPMCQWGATFCARARWRSTAGEACARVAKEMRKKDHSTPLAPFFSPLARTPCVNGALPFFFHSLRMPSCQEGATFHLIPITSMPEFRRAWLPHEVPSWIDPTQEAFFITINCLPRGENQLAHQTVWQAILETITFREERGDWKWSILLAMPDHLHGIVRFPEGFFMSKCITDWKRWLATKHKIQWQDGYFDHRLRSLESASEKADYIRMNPVRAGLVVSPTEWPYARDWRIIR